MKAYVRLIFILISFVACVACAAFCLFGIWYNVLAPLCTIISLSSVLFGTFYNVKKSDRNLPFRVVGIILTLVFAFVCVGSILFAVYRAGETAAAMLGNFLSFA